MAVVTHIEERRSLIHVDVDGRLLCKVKKSFFQKLPLSEGDVLDEQQYLDRLAALQLNACYEDALSLLDFSARASGEMRRKLLLKGYLEPVVDAAIQRLSENRLIDDARYAERVVESACGKVGLFALKRKLRAKGIDEETAEAALDAVDEADQLDAAKHLAQKLLHKYAAQDERQARAKISQALARRGFSWDVVSAALEGLFNGDWDE